MTLADCSMTAFALLNGGRIVALSRRKPMALIDLETALSRNNSLQSAQPPSFEAVIRISAVEKLISSPAHQPVVPASKPLLLAKPRGFAVQLLGALHESRRRRAAIILREHAPLTQLRRRGQQ
jgi:hypothetical protein